ncbi:hypothetical protein SDC9_151760 [bioreactor metagenome]|uniref:Uncharacterized protein n=1 Tax=bioreactor metagenome TaxID=1076179 RepID=A0A645ETJ5_9ZZZZ
MYLNDGTVIGRTVDCNLEFARQIGEFRVESAPLPHDLAPRTRVDLLVASDAGEGVGGDVTDAVARGLDGVHLHRGQLGQDFGHVFELGPVELQILARREVTVTAIIGACDVGEHAHLLGAQVAVGHGDAQHRRMALDVEAVLQAQWAEFVLAQFAGEIAARLVAELGDPFIHDPLIVFVVLVHRFSLSASGRVMQRGRPGVGLGAGCSC